MGTDWEVTCKMTVVCSFSATLSDWDGSGLCLESEVMAGNPASLRIMLCKTLVLVLPSRGNVSGAEAVMTNTSNFSFAAADFWICIGFAERRAWCAESKRGEMFKLGKEWCVGSGGDNVGLSM